MRSTIFISFLVLGISCASTKNTVMKTNKLDGTWVPVQQEIGGVSLPKASFEKQRLTISDSTYTVIAESVDKGVVKYKDDKMDIYSKEGVNAGKHFTAIYKFENEQLIICYNLSGDSYPETFGTKGKPLYFLSVFRKELMK
ncbi:MAG: TIGR03067 domain-containing protein [Bacteroidota bacterium]|nr:TIGR03067 domain-containing protein [Bacteroidota bacterium]